MIEKNRSGRIVVLRDNGLKWRRTGFPFSDAGIRKLLPRREKRLRMFLPFCIAMTMSKENSWIRVYVGNERDII